MRYATYEQIVANIRALPTPGLIAIDGLPVSGKSTLADRLRDELNLQAIFLDDFVRPQAEWPSRTQPAFPFQYIRYDEFLTAIHALAKTGKTTFHPFDWSSLTTARQPRTVRLDKTVLIEGVSALNAEVNALYALRIFVDSDRTTTLDAARARGVGGWEQEWRNLFLPSADLYMQTMPQHRADLIYAGRGSAA